jgi:hypothetical protein
MCKYYTNKDTGKDNRILSSFEDNSEPPVSKEGQFPSAGRRLDPSTIREERGATIRNRLSY